MAKYDTPNATPAEVTAEMTSLLRRSGSQDYRIAIPAQRHVAKALELTLQSAILKGNILGDIYETNKFGPGEATEYPLDFLTPGNEKHHIAYTLANTGEQPQRVVTGDYVMVPTFSVGNNISWPLRYAEAGRWDIVGRAMQVFEAGVVRKNNIDGMNVIVASGYSRSLVVYDDQAPAGLFSKRLVALMKTVMRRQAGGNTTSLKKGKLTHLMISPEAMEDIRSWDLTQIDDVTRREIYLAGDDGVTSIFGVKIIPLDELGVGQELDAYFVALGGSLPGSKTELVIGLDLSNRDSFVHPVRKEFMMFEDPTLHRRQEAGVYGWGEHGYSSLNSRRVLLGAL